MLASNWTAEYITVGERHCHKIKQSIYANKSRFQNIHVVETESYGMGLLLDGRIQHVAYDEYIYSESMVHPAMVLRGAAIKNAICIGGGPGGVIRELVKHKTLEKITQIEIDESIITLSKIFFPHIANGCYGDKRVRIIIDDISNYLENAQDKNQKVDLVISDLSEPLAGSPAENIFNYHKFRQIKNILSVDGLFVLWGGSVGPCSFSFAVALVKLVRSIFEYCGFLITYPQSYGTSWLTIIAGQSEIAPFQKTIKEIDHYIDTNINGLLRLYDGETHYHMFYLPKDVRMKVYNL